MDAKSFLLELQERSKTFTAAPLEEFFPNLLLDIKNDETTPTLDFALKQHPPYLPGKEVEVVSLSLEPLMGRPVQLQDFPRMDSRETFRFLKYLHRSKVEQIKEQLAFRGGRKRILVLRRPPLQNEMRFGPQWKEQQRFSVAVAVGMIPVRVNIATATGIYAGESMMLWSTLFLGTA